MIQWKKWEGIASQWDKMVQEFPDYTVYQSFAWGEHRQTFGWHAIRMFGGCDEKILCCAQVLVRQMTKGVNLVWVPGGPVGDPADWAHSFLRGLKIVLGCQFVYCRINNMRKEIPRDLATMLGAWKKPEYRIHTGLSMAFITAGDENKRIQRTSSNWGRNLRRSQRQGNSVRLWESPDPAELHAVYREMQEFKSISEQFSQEALASILNCFGSQCLVVRCDDAEGRLLAFRGALLFGDRGWDIFAATTTAGRKVYASHAACWELINQCIGLGVTWYDLGGVDPEGGKGVYDFKKGTGADDLKYLGEWESANFPFLRKLSNFVIKRRLQLP